jgi:hypothetical protein
MIFFTGLLLETSLETVRAHLDSWNETELLGLSAHGSQNGLLGRSVGNGLITAHDIAGQSTHINLYAILDLSANDGDSPFDNEICAAWNRLGEFFVQKAWLKNFEKIKCFQKTLGFIQNIAHYSSITLAGKEEAKSYVLKARSELAHHPSELEQQVDYWFSKWARYHDKERWADKLAYEGLAQREHQTVFPIPSNDFFKTVKQGAIKDIVSKKAWLLGLAKQSFTELAKQLATSYALNSTLSNQDLKTILNAFKYHIQSQKRMEFWRDDPNARRKYWKASPELHAKSLLITFLEARNCSVVDEIRVGAGRTDIFVDSPQGKKAIIELKMCGHNYSLQYARGGLEQILHYMENKNVSDGYLLVFDSRKGFSNGFQEAEFFEGVPITVICIDVRPYVKFKDMPEDE